jgi:hypothetical protein
MRLNGGSTSETVKVKGKDFGYSWQSSIGTALWRDTDNQQWNRRTTAAMAKEVVNFTFEVRDSSGHPPASAGIDEHRFHGQHFYADIYLAATVKEKMFHE